MTFNLRWEPTHCEQAWFTGDWKEQWNLWVGKQLVAAIESDYPDSGGKGDKHCWVCFYLLFLVPMAFADPLNTGSVHRKHCSPETIRGDTREEVQQLVENFVNVELNQFLEQ